LKGDRKDEKMKETRVCGNPIWQRDNKRTNNTTQNRQNIIVLTY